MKKKKKTSIVIGTMITLLSFSLNAQQISVSVSGTLLNSNIDSIAISYFLGNGYKDFIKIPIKKDGLFKIQGNLPSKDVYVLRLGNSGHLNLILRDKSELKVFSDLKNPSLYTNIVGSDESSNLNKFISKWQVYRIKEDSARTYLNEHPDKQKEVNESFTPFYQDFESYKLKLNMHDFFFTFSQSLINLFNIFICQFLYFIHFFMNFILRNALVFFHFLN